MASCLRQQVLFVRLSYPPVPYHRTLLDNRLVMRLRSLVLASIGVFFSLGCRTSASAREPMPPSSECDLATDWDVARHVDENLAAPARAVGLRPLAGSSLPDAVREIRLWYTRAFDPVRRLLLIRATADSVHGELVLIWSVEEDGRVTYGNPVTLTASCLRASEHRPGAALCVAAVDSVVSWTAVLGRLEQANVWMLPEGSQLPRQHQVTDGHSVTVEVRRGPCYRAYGYANPEAEPSLEHRQAATLIRTVIDVEAVWTGHRR